MFPYCIFYSADTLCFWNKIVYDMYMSTIKNHNILKHKFIYTLCILILSLCHATPVYAVLTPSTITQAEEAELRKTLPIATDDILGWPKGPKLGAASAILMDADTGVILYEKNAHEKLYPASTTKLLTSLIACENTTMDEVVTFSKDAVFGIERNSSHIGIDVGEQLTMEQCLYGILLGSANEVSYATAEHVGGDLTSFVQMMNDRAAAIGCTETHFCNANGLPDPDHYTTAYDLALIARECYKNEIIAKISGTTRYTIPPTNKQIEERPLTNHHLLMPGLKYEYEYVIGGKTGYTDEARQTLVTCAEKDGLKLICIIMKEESPNQFLDTIELFNYGFDNFQILNIATNETGYTMDSDNFFNTNMDILGSSKPLLTINTSGSILIPKSAVFTDAVPEIQYITQNPHSAAILSYYFGDAYVGSTSIDFVTGQTVEFEFSKIINDSNTKIPTPVEKDNKIIFVNVRLIIIIILVIVGVILIMFLVHAILNNVYFSKKKRRKRRRRIPSRYDNLKF